MLTWIDELLDSDPAFRVSMEGMDRADELDNMAIFDYGWPVISPLGLLKDSQRLIGLIVWLIIRLCRLFSNPTKYLLMIFL